MANSQPNLSPKKLSELSEEYILLRDQEKSIKERKEFISNLLKAYALENGVADDKGSRFVECPNSTFGVQSRKSVSFKPDAIKWFKDRGFNEAIVVTETINNKAVEALIDRGHMSVDQLEKLTDVKETFAIDVKVKTEMPEVEETTVQIAASKRVSSLFRGNK